MGSSRRFSKTERNAIYVASGGKCAICGEALESEWHADHVIPWSADGKTIVTNGQALCVACNLRKGSRA